MSRPSDNDYAIDAFVDRAIRDGHLVEAEELGRAVAHADHLQGEIEELHALLAHLRRDETQEALRQQIEKLELTSRFGIDEEGCEYERAAYYAAQAVAAALRPLLLEPEGKEPG